jgi:hypothetical protein
MRGYEMVSNNIKSSGNADASTEFSAEADKVGLMVMLKTDGATGYSVSHSCKARVMSTEDYAE